MCASHEPLLLPFASIAAGVAIAGNQPIPLRNACLAGAGMTALALTAHFSRQIGGTRRVTFAAGLGALGFMSAMALVAARPPHASPRLTLSGITCLRSSKAAWSIQHCLPPTANALRCNWLRGLGRRCRCRRARFPIIQPGPFPNCPMELSSNSRGKCDGRITTTNPAPSIRFITWRASRFTGRRRETLRTYAAWVAGAEIALRVSSSPFDPPLSIAWIAFTPTTLTPTA